MYILGLTTPQSPSRPVRRWWWGRDKNKSEAARCLRICSPFLLSHENRSLHKQPLQRSAQPAACFFDSMHVTTCNKTGGPDARLANQIRISTMLTGMEGRLTGYCIPNPNHSALHPLLAENVSRHSCKRYMQLRGPPVR